MTSNDDTTRRIHFAREQYGPTLCLGYDGHRHDAIIWTDEGVTCPDCLRLNPSQYVTDDPEVTP